MFKGFDLEYIQKALPYVLSVYSIIWFALIGYLFSIGNRLGKVDQQLSLLKNKKK